jgi:hypothetical protein
MPVLLWNVVIVIGKPINSICYAGFPEKTTVHIVRINGNVQRPQFADKWRKLMPLELGLIIVDLDSVPEVLRKLIYQIEHLIDEKIKIRSRTHPPKLRRRTNNVVVMWNIFSDHHEILDTLFKHINKILDSNFSRIKGEVIKLDVGSGTIHDMGTREFQIIEGKTWNIYVYDPEDFLYVRLLREARLNSQEQWISVDIDYILNSAWFVD